MIKLPIKRPSKKITLIITAIGLVLFAAGGSGLWLNHKAQLNNSAKEEITKQYETPPVEVTPEMQKQNDQRAVAVDFYYNLPRNSNTIQAYLIKYGTKNLVAQYNTRKTSSFNPLSCSKNEPTSSSVLSQKTAADGRINIAMQLMNGSETIGVAQVLLVASGDKYLIDSIACPGPI